ncbi:MAG: transporter [Clostridia bacterium]|nr:transporter [Clostridia bacterium]
MNEENNVVKQKTTERKSKKNLVKNIIILQAIILVYTLASVAAKFASGEEFLSFKFIVFYGLEIFILGVYAILWQQIIKKFEISIAYANRAMALLWSLVWAVVFFHETITIKNVIGVIIVVIGTIIVNSDE